MNEGLVSSLKAQKISGSSISVTSYALNTMDCFCQLLTSIHDHEVRFHMALEDGKVGEGVSVFRTFDLPGWCGLVAPTMQAVDVLHVLD